MTYRRSTIDRHDLLRPLNAALASDAYGTAGRKALADVASAALLASNAYRGFRYLPSELAEGLDGELALRPGYDDTRREYL